MEYQLFDPPFPVGALTATLRAVADFINLTNQSPIEMCASSVLSAGSLACQGLVNVHWRRGVHSPVSLIIVIEAESGERKSANDEIAFKVIRRFDAQQRVLAEQEEATQRNALKLWKLKYKAAEKTLLKQTMASESTAAIEAELAELENNRPRRPKRARMLLANATRQAVARHLGTLYPFAGIIADEGKVVLNSDALGDLGMLNKIWDGGPWVSDRVTRERIELIDTRLTVLLQLQPGVAKHFLVFPTAEAHATGFSSRWFYLRPKSRQGERLRRFVDIPTEGIEGFNKAVLALLTQYEGPELPTLASLELTDAAVDRLAWFSEEVEVALGDGQWFCMMRGNASKAAEQCARLAAVMHCVEGYTGPISAEIIYSAIKLVAWFMNQFRMRFCPKSQLELDAMELEDCISRHAYKFKKTRSVPGPDLCRLAPRHLRQVDTLKATLRTLEAQGKLKVWEGPSWNVHLHWWFPGEELPRQASASTPAGSFSPSSPRWSQNAAQAAPADITSPSGYELWPGVYLR
jgi:hypothetical protein